MADVKAGTRFLRHNAASRLLHAAVPLAGDIGRPRPRQRQDSTSLYMSDGRGASACSACCQCLTEPTAMKGHAVHSAHSPLTWRPYLAFKAEHGLQRRTPVSGI